VHIEQIVIRNYKSYYESGPLQLTSGFNIIVGPNNVGKTALIEAVSLHFTNKPHRSLRTMPQPRSRTEPTSRVVLKVHLDAGEARQLLMDAVDDFWVPVHATPNPPEQPASVLAALEHPGVFWAAYDSGNLDLASAHLSALGQIQSEFRLNFVVDRQQQTLAFAQNTQSGNTYNGTLGNAIKDRLYIFNAERLNVSKSVFGTGRTLMSNAQNLAEVLHNLQSDWDKYLLLNRYMTEIFPDIGRVAVPSGPASNEVQIKIWSTEAVAANREDLAVELAESGTGIGQVLAILYVVLTADRPRIVAIDEPQSFLNPGAVRKLIEILKQHLQHQFILATHSADVIAAASPRTLLLLTKEGAETHAKVIDREKAEELRSVLSEVGARLSDVFGADNILWVEGATEERCFPVIVEKVLHLPLMGTRIIGVLQTGDLESDDPERVALIYRRLSQGGSLLPPAVGFIFDREARTQDKRDDIARTIRQAGARVEFTRRRMYENYLLNPEAIAAVVADIADFFPEPVTADKIGAQIEALRADKALFDAGAGADEQSGDNWIEHIHGAKVLIKLFLSLSEQRVSYDKKVHGLALTEWIVERSPQDLSEVADLLRSMLPTDDSQASRLAPLDDI
jgi:predicted ATPase